MASAALWGRDEVEYGDVAVAEPDPRVALALSRGRTPKSYAWTDPNEDAIAASVGAHATLIVVADGHSGRLAAEGAVEAVVARLGDDPPPADLSDGELVAVFAEANAAALSAGERGGAPRSRATLTMALVTADALQWAAVGDSPLLVVTPPHATELTRPAHRFVGEPLSSERLARRLGRGRARLDEGAWVVVASDGFSNFVLGADAAASAAVVLTDVASAGEAVRALVAHAFAGGAGDNVAVAVVAPTPSEQ